MKRLVLIFIAMLFVGGCVIVEYTKESYVLVGDKMVLKDKERLKYHSNDENIKTSGLKLKLSKDNGAELGIGKRLDKGDPNLIKAYGTAGSDVIGSLNGTGAIKSLAP